MKWLFYKCNCDICNNCEGVKLLNGFTSPKYSLYKLEIITLTILPVISLISMSIQYTKCSCPFHHWYMCTTLENGQCNNNMFLHPRLVNFGKTVPSFKWKIPKVGFEIQHYLEYFDASLEYGGISWNVFCKILRTRMFVNTYESLALWPFQAEKLKVISYKSF